MRSTSLFCILFTLISLCAYGQDIVVDNPPFRVANQTYLEVERVTITDTQTIVDMVGFGDVGGWMRLFTSTAINVGGTDYVVKSAEGITLNEKMYHTEEGRRPFKLFFDAIPKETKEITFDSKGGAFIKDIQLKADVFKRELPQEFSVALNIIDDGKPLPVPELIDGAATVKGQIIGYFPEMNSKIVFYVNNALTHNQESYSCKVSEDGTFECTIPLVSTVFVLAQLDRLFNTDMVLSPNGETSMYIDLEQKSCQDARLRKDKCEKERFVYFAGANAELNNQLFGKEYERYKSKYENSYNRLMKDIVGMSAIQYRDYLYSEEENRLADIEKLNVTKKMKEYLSICERYDLFRWLSMGDFYLEDAYGKANGGNTDGFEKPVFDEEYFVYAKELPFNNPKSFYSDNYNVAIYAMKKFGNELKLPIYMHQTTTQMLDEIVKQPFYDSKYDDVIEYLRLATFEKKDPATIKDAVAKYKVIADALKKEERLKGDALNIADRILTIDNISTEKEFEYYKNLIANLYYAGNNIVSDSMFLAKQGIKSIYGTAVFDTGVKPDSLLIVKAQEFDSNKDIRHFFGNWNNILSLERETEGFRKLTGIDKGLSFDLLFAQSQSGRFEQMEPFSDLELDFYGKYFDDPFFAQYFTRKNNDLLEQIEENKKNLYNVHQTPEVAEDQLLHEILKPFEGKVIFIDFWNTWCGPCRDAMKEFKETKESYKGKDVAFIYLADESSPEVAWNNMIASIGGEHFRLKDEQMAHLRAKFSFNGIPSYAIFNKKGEQVYFRTGFEGAKRISEIIDKHLAD